MIPRPVETRYGLRSASNGSLPTPYSRLSSTKNSFVHTTVKLWNGLENDVRSIESLSSFKRKLNVLFHKEHDVKFIPMLYSLNPTGNAPVYHCRLRLGLSALNYHRFTYNFIAIKSCPNCNHEREDNIHYLLHCPAYAAPRSVLLESLRNHLPIDILNSENSLVNLLLFGSRDLSTESNLLVFSDVFIFLEASGRFT